MLEQILECKKCNLCRNQKPLLDCSRNSQVFWVGLSAKKVTSENDIPLAPQTNTGMIIQEIEKKCCNITTYKTNLVKCVPLTEERKLRYPKRCEINCCYENLKHEIELMSPKIVFLLGEKVYTSVEKEMNTKFCKWNGFDYYYKKVNGIYYVPIHHPSYIYVYKRKYMQEYISSVEKIIKYLL